MFAPIKDAFLDAAVRKRAELLLDEQEDESGSGGLWDYAGDTVSDILYQPNLELDDSTHNVLQNYPNTTRR